MTGVPQAIAGWSELRSHSSAPVVSERRCSKEGISASVILTILSLTARQNPIQFNAGVRCPPALQLKLRLASQGLAQELYLILHFFGSLIAYQCQNGP